MPKRIKMMTRVPAIRPAKDGSKAERDEFYTGRRWRALRAKILSKNPLCLECLRQGKVKAATMVHHLVERLVDAKLAYVEANLEASCNPCHTRRHKRTS